MKKKIANPSCRVLVVDDNLDGAETLDLVLRLNGAETRVAHDGAAGVAAFNSFKPDVIVADAHMPGMGGAEMAMRIRADKDNRHVLLIALTGDSRPEFKEHLIQAGFNRYALKPIKITDLWQMIEEHCAA